jgi:hypothetical protein
MHLFAQLMKFDEFTGVATGVAACEEIDRDKEIMDYQGSKPYFQAWSQTQKSASIGKSLGNVRLQHDASKIAGKLTDLTFDDTNKRVIVSTQIIDPVARELLRTGCLTGFSIGGEYGKRTTLPNGVTKYVAIPAEISVVDRPCMPSATFTAVKSDGSTELRKFAPRTEQSKVMKRIGVYSERRLALMVSRGYQPL